MDKLIIRNTIINRLSQKYSGNARDDLGRLMGNSNGKDNQILETLNIFNPLVPYFDSLPTGKSVGSFFDLLEPTDLPVGAKALQAEPTGLPVV